MTTTLDTAATVRAPFSAANQVGLVLAGLLAVPDLISLVNPTPEGQVGPPLGILALNTALGVLTLVAVIVAWRSRSRGWVRLAAGSRILSMLTALPAFFVDVPAFLVALVAAFTVVTIAAVVLMLLPSPRSE